ncbi:hypothetical protein QL285_092338 [Trifolium repens]|nr:hypothetical protein QL285_092338 [Trifolium repens]
MGPFFFEVICKALKKYCKVKFQLIALESFSSSPLCFFFTPQKFDFALTKKSGSQKPKLYFKAKKNSVRRNRIFYEGQNRKLRGYKRMIGGCKRNHHCSLL